MVQAETDKKLLCDNHLCYLQHRLFFEVPYAVALRLFESNAASGFIYQPALSEEQFATWIGALPMTSRRQLFSGLALLLPSNFRGSWFAWSRT